MSKSFRKLQIKRQPRNHLRESAEARFWRSFKFPKSQQIEGVASFVNFSPAFPFDFVVTSATSVQLFNGESGEVKRSLTRFNGTPYSAMFRSDGRLIVTGESSGAVKIFDAESRAILRTFHGHKEPVHTTVFSSNNVNVMSGGDDRTIRYWDLSTGSCSSIAVTHEDYVRTVASHPSDPHLWFSGSYDHTVKLWDIRKFESTSAEVGDSMAIPQMKFNHGDPIDSLLLLPGGGLLVTSGGDWIKIWDIISGGKLLHSFSGHQKASTHLFLDGSSTRMLSAGLDGQVKVYDLATYQVTHSFKYDSPILSADISPDNKRLVVGMVDGQICTRTRLIKNQDQDLSVQPIQSGSTRYYFRGQNHKMAPYDLRIEHQRKAKLQPYDMFLKKFQYRNAMDAAIMAGNKLAIMSLFDEFIQRSGLRIALSGRNDETLEPILRFVIRNIDDPRYSDLVHDVANCILDIYTPVVGQSPRLDELLVGLHSRLQREMRLQKRLLQLLGCMETLFASKSQKGPVDKNHESTKLLVQES